ncbi:hypothetical protein MUK42_28674 [Musa troglodytarum]|uniref:Uncharacterized protein n=1 Tax=Musa troglodytarum TaxID=320322 RepID=A0A9E7JZD8_9LILI|nr:hypothetical protein MUK42_10585 [Musa troglodytarum]URD99285.1 hypothetical protein MUK42_28674 [Musa troglodytarum]
MVRGSSRSWKLKSSNARECHKPYGRSRSDSTRFLIAIKSRILLLPLVLGYYYYHPTYYQVGTDMDMIVARIWDDMMLTHPRIKPLLPSSNVPWSN